MSSHLWKETVFHENSKTHGIKPTFQEGQPNSEMNCGKICVGLAPTHFTLLDQNRQFMVL